MSGYDVLRGHIGFPDRYLGVHAEYAHLNAAVPRGAKVLAAVDYPSLLSFSRYRFATLDLAGSASPPPHMPYFAGAEAKVDYLRRLGYDYIVADAVTERGLYQLKPWLDDLRSPRYNYRAWAPYFIDWMSSVTTLEHDDARPVRYFGSLALIPIGGTCCQGSSRRDPGQKTPAASPAASVAPSSAARSKSSGAAAPTTVTGASTRRHRSPVAMRSTLATAPSTSVSPLTRSP